MVPAGTCRGRIGAVCRDFGENGLGGQHAALHSRVGTLDLWHVHETGAAANQQPSREGQLWDGLQEERELVALLSEDVLAMFYVLYLFICHQLFADILKPDIKFVLVIQSEVTPAGTGLK